MNTSGLNVVVVVASVLTGLTAGAGLHRTSETCLDGWWSFSREGKPFRSVRLPHDWGAGLSAKIEIDVK